MSETITNTSFGQIDFSSEQADLLEVATRFCGDRSSIDKVRKLINNNTGYDEHVWREIVDFGWLGVTVHEEIEGGIGLSIAELIPIVEQMGRRLLASPFISTVLAIEALRVGGTTRQQGGIIPSLVKGRIATTAFLEPDGQWDFSTIKAQATGNDQIALSGIKTLVLNAHSADLFLVSVMRDNKPAIVMIDRKDIPETNLRRETLIDETRRSYELNLEGIVCRSEHFLDGEKAAQTLEHVFLAGTLLSAAQCCGAAQSVIDYTADYLRTRKQFGKLIGSYQGLKHPMVDAFIGVEQARSHLYSAASSFNRQGAGEIATHMARAQADRALSFAADRSIQFHGGFGFTYDCDAQLYRRHAIWHAAMYGDAAYHRRKLGDLLF